MSIKNKVTGELSNITTYGPNGRISDITLPGNVTAGASVNADILNVASLSNLGNVGNLVITGGNPGQAIITDGTGNLAWGNAGSTIASVPAVYFTAGANANSQTFSNVVLSSYTANTDMTVFYNGSLLPNEYYTLSGSTLTVNTLMFVGDTIDVVTQVAGNVLNVTSGYGDSNVTSLLSTGVTSNVITTGNISGDYFVGNGALLTGINASSNYSNVNAQALLNSGAFTGDFIPNGNATQDLGNATNQWKDLWLSGNTLYMTQVPISMGAGNVLRVNGANVVTSTPSGNINGNGLTINGNATITGNALVQGTLTYNDVTDVSTSNLVLSLGFNQSGILVDGGGITIGSTEEAQLLYDEPTQTWNSNLGINATGNVTADYFIGDGSQLTGLPAGYSNTNVVDLLSSGNVTSNVITTGNVSGSYFIGNGSQLTGMYGNINVTNLLSSGNVTSNVITTGNVSGSYLLGNGTYLTNVVATTSIINGTSNARVYSNGNVTMSVANIANVVTITSDTLRVAGNIYDITGQVYGVAASFAKYTRSTVQTGVVANTVIVLNIAESAFGSDITVDTTTGNVTLQAGKTYRLRGSVGASVANSGANPSVVLTQWYNVTTGQWVGQSGGPNSSASGYYDTVPMAAAEYVVTPATTTVLQFRMRYCGGYTLSVGPDAANLVQTNGGWPWLDIQVIGGGSPITSGVPNWTNAGTIQAVGLGGTTTAPTVSTGGSITRNVVRYKQIGLKTWQVMVTFNGTGLTGGATGNGDYLLTLPNGLQFDTTVQPTYTANIGAATWTFLDYQIPGNQVYMNGNDSQVTYNTGGIVPWSPTQYRVCLPIINTGVRCWGSGWFQWSGFANLATNYTFTFQSL